MTAVFLKTIEDALSLVRAKSTGLDPRSRYIRELFELIEPAKDLAELESKLDRGCRGKLHAGDDTWSRMSLEEKLLANLVTNETELLRFDPTEVEYLKREVFPWLRSTAGRVASIPCSHGLEPVSLAVEMLGEGLEWFHIHGFDIQRACVETAMTGRIPVAGLPRYVVAVVDPKVMNHLSFHVLDALTDAIPGRFDFVLCRNFLGYWKPGVARAVLEKLVAALDRPGCLLVDRFITTKHPEIFSGLGVERRSDVPALWKK